MSERKTLVFSTPIWQRLRSYITQSQGACLSHILGFSCSKWAISLLSSSLSLHWVVFLTRPHIPSTFSILNPSQPAVYSFSKKEDHPLSFTSSPFSVRRTDWYFPRGFFPPSWPSPIYHLDSQSTCYQTPGQSTPVP